MRTELEELQITKLGLEERLRNVKSRIRLLSLAPTPHHPNIGAKIQVIPVEPSRLHYVALSDRHHSHRL